MGIQTIADSKNRAKLVSEGSCSQGGWTQSVSRYLTLAKLVEYMAATISNKMREPHKPNLGAPQEYFLRLVRRLRCRMPFKLVRELPLMGSEVPMAAVLLSVFVDEATVRRRCSAIVACKRYMYC
mmetsp:Transcript_12999/g.30779  ORF Transcript_12999/g.30779 Transcript_12999/m.30779 type:complete len:125 (+) Transcript_12999:1079-1453(+)